MSQPNIDLRLIPGLALLALLLSTCKFEPDIEPLIIEEIPGQSGPSELPHPEEGTLEELAYWADQYGFGKDGRPSLDGYYDPYHRSDPVTGEIGFGPTDELSAAADKIYANEGDLDELARADPNNPVNYWDDDPITILDGDERLQMAFVMASGFSKPHIGRFLDLIGADPSQEWNYEPAWVSALMRQYPNELLQAKWETLHQFASNPELFDFVQGQDPTGPTD